MRLSSNFFYPLVLAAALVASVSCGIQVTKALQKTDANGTTTSFAINDQELTPAANLSKLLEYIRDGTGKVTGLTAYAPLAVGANSLKFEDGRSRVLTLALDTPTAGVHQIEVTTPPLAAAVTVTKPKVITDFAHTVAGAVITFGVKNDQDINTITMGTPQDAKLVISMLHSNGYAYIEVPQATAALNNRLVTPIADLTHQCFLKGTQVLCIKKSGVTVFVAVRPYEKTFWESTYGKFTVSIIALGSSVILSAVICSRLHYLIDPDGYAAGYIASSLFGSIKSMFMVTPDGLTDEQINIALHEDGESDSDYYTGQTGTDRRPKGRSGAPAADADDESAEPDAEEVDARAISVAAIALLLPFLL